MSELKVERTSRDYNECLGRTVYSCDLQRNFHYNFVEMFVIVKVLNLHKCVPKTGIN